MGRACLLALVFFTAAMLTACGSSSSSSPASPPPPRTVTVNWVNTYWSPSGQVQVPALASAALNIEALVPQADGSITLLKGSATSTPGVFVIPNVPAGNYWLAAGNGGAFWTSTSTFDAGTDIAAGQTPLTSTSNTTTFDLSVSGIASETTEEYVEFFTDPPAGDVLFGLPPDYTGLTGGFGAGGYIDWSQINTGFLMQYELEPLGSLNNYVLGPELTLSNLAFTNGATNTISGTLNAAGETSLALSVSGSQWASAFNKVGPAAATVQDSVLTLTAEPYVTGINASPNTGLSLIARTPGALGILFQNQGVVFDSLGTCADYTGEPGIDAVAFNPPILTDQNFGTLQYGDPFDSTWTRALALCQQATIPIPLPNSSGIYSFLLVDGESAAPSNSPLAPIALPVQNPMMNGSSFFTANITDAAAPALSWTAPTGAAPYGYLLREFVLTTSNDAPSFQQVGTYSTSATSVTLPPLAGGNTYIFTITTKVDGVANMQTSPYRSALPTGFASVVSAPLTISPAAAAPQIDGDIEEWRSLVRPKPDSHANAKTQAPAVPCNVSGHSLVRTFCE